MNIIYYLYQHITGPLIPGLDFISPYLCPDLLITDSDLMVMLHAENSYISVRSQGYG